MIRYTDDLAPVREDMLQGFFAGWPKCRRPASGHLGQRVDPVGDRGDLAALDQLAHDGQIILALLGHEEGHFLVGLRLIIDGFKTMRFAR